MKNLYVIYHYSFDQTYLKPAYVFDQEQFPIHLELDSQTFTSKTELKDALLTKALELGYRSVKLMSNEAYNTLLEQENYQERLIDIFEREGENLKTTTDHDKGFISKLFGRD